MYPGSQPLFKKWYFLLDDDKPPLKKWWFVNQAMKKSRQGLPGYCCCHQPCWMVDSKLSQRVLYAHQPGISKIRRSYTVHVFQRGFLFPGIHSFICKSARNISKLLVSHLSIYPIFNFREAKPFTSPPQIPPRSLIGWRNLRTCFSDDVDGGGWRDGA